MKTVIVFPAHKRPKVTLATLQWLKNLPQKPEVVCVGDSEAEERIVNKAGVHYVEHPNTPLSAKFQAGITFAKSLSPDFVVTAGSDSWITPCWIDEAVSFLGKTGADMVGKSRFAIWNLDIMHILLREYQQWRNGEPFDTGRVITAKGMKKLKWVLYPPSWRLSHGLDAASHKLCVEKGLKIGIMNFHNDEWILEIKIPLRYESIIDFRFSIDSRFRRLSEIKGKNAFDWLDSYFPYWDEYLADVLREQGVTR